MFFIFENMICVNVEFVILGVNEMEMVNVGDGVENGCFFLISSGSVDYVCWFIFMFV